MTGSKPTQAIDYAAINISQQNPGPNWANIGKLLEFLTKLQAGIFITILPATI